MNNLNEIIDQLAAKYVISKESITLMWDAMVKGNGSEAQFDHSELGGKGHWKSGGDLIIGSMYNHCLREKIKSLIEELQPLVETHLAKK